MTDKKPISPDEAPAAAPSPEAGPAAAPDAPDAPRLPDGTAGPAEPETDEVKHLKAKVKKRDGELRLLRKERDEWRDQLLRKLADMENLKKRLDRDKSEYLQFALAEFIKTILPILDNLERALDKAEGGEDGPGIQEGLRLIHKQFLDILVKHGVSPIRDVVHHKFDPNLHHALATEESDEVEEPQVIEEMQRGYTLHDRLLRPSLVRVRVPRKTNA